MVPRPWGALLSARARALTTRVSTDGEGWAPPDPGPPATVPEGVASATVRSASGTAGEVTLTAGPRRAPAGAVSTAPSTCTSPVAVAVTVGSEMAATSTMRSSP